MRRSAREARSVRPARADEAGAIADLYLRSREAADGVPAAVHTDAEVLAWLTGILGAGATTWVTDEAGGGPAAMMVLRDGWVEQLYVAPEAQGRGHGSALLGFAQSRHGALSLWTFAANAGAREFYEARGFRPDGPPDRENEERTPAIRYRWTRGGPASRPPRRD